MQRFFTLLGMALILPLVLKGQVKKQLSIDNHPQCETVRLNLKAHAGTCFIKPTDNPELLCMYSNQNPDAYAHQLTKEIRGKTCDIKIFIDEPGRAGLGQTISAQLFGNEPATGQTFWKVYLTQQKTYNLALNYALGEANIDLSGLAIENFRLLSGSSSVRVGYPTGVENKVPMDTFYVKVELGSVTVNNLSLSRARHVMADVGFGNLTLDLSNKPLNALQVYGSVGAGNLIIILPEESIPTLVKVKDSWLCSVKLTPNFNKISEGTFATSSYNGNDPNTLVFNLEVSMGNIIFRNKGRN
jgi:hypothetical protein